MELYKLSAAELAKMLREGKCTSTQILDSIYERIDAVEDKVEAFVTITREEAYAKAKEIDEKFARGEELHPLAGIPIAIKDNICTKDVLTTCSSKMLYNFVPPYDATVMQKLNDCGAILVGKPNMDEFAPRLPTSKRPRTPEVWIVCLVVLRVVRQQLLRLVKLRSLWVRIPVAPSASLPASVVSLASSPLTVQFPVTAW